MNPPPAQLDGADVLGFVIVRPERHAPPPTSILPAFVHPTSGASEQGYGRLVIHHYLADGQSLGRVPALAICCYTGGDQVYLFYCSADWEVLQDDALRNLEEALAQATVQYPGLTRADWQWCAVA